MKNETLLYTKDLAIGYSSNKTVQSVGSGINLALQAGKLTAVVGGNGIGKSTLLRTLSGLQQPLSGAVYLQQQPLSAYAAADAARLISIVLTERLPPGNLTVAELVALGRHPYTNWIGKLSAADYIKIDEAIERTQIRHLIDKKHYEISDGQLQKALIARALAQDAPIIILDEPTTHLDFEHKLQLFHLLHALTRETGKCILFSTHDIDLAIALCDDMIVMTAGKVVQHTSQQLIADDVFNTLFADPAISFNNEERKFTYKKP